MKQELNEFQQLIADLSDGNPGALNVMCGLAQKYPESLLWLLFKACELKNFRGSAFWILYKDHCDQDLEKTLAGIIKAVR